MNMTDMSVATMNFVARHKTKIAVAVTAVACMTVNQIAVRQHNDFLKEHDLYDSFYGTLED